MSDGNVVAFRAIRADEPEPNPFEPCTVTGLARRLWQAYGEKRSLEKEIALLRDILTDWCRKNGEVVEVEGQPALRLVSEYEWIRDHPREVWNVRFDRRGRDGSGTD